MMVCIKYEALDDNFRCLFWYPLQSTRVSLGFNTVKFAIAYLIARGAARCIHAHRHRQALGCPLVCNNHMDSTICQSYLGGASMTWFTVGDSPSWSCSSMSSKNSAGLDTFWPNNCFVTIVDCPAVKFIHWLQHVILVTSYNTNYLVHSILPVLTRGILCRHRSQFFAAPFQSRTTCPCWFLLGLGGNRCIHARNDLNHPKTVTWTPRVEDRKRICDRRLCTYPILM